MSLTRQVGISAPRRGHATPSLPSDYTPDAPKDASIRQDRSASALSPFFQALFFLFEAMLHDVSSNATHK